MRPILLKYLGESYFNLTSNEVDGEMDLKWIKELPLVARSKGIIEIQIEVQIFKSSSRSDSDNMMYKNNSKRFFLMLRHVCMNKFIYTHHTT